MAELSDEDRRLTEVGQRVRAEESARLKALAEKLQKQIDDKKK